jgi:hypothetical protein
MWKIIFVNFSRLGQLTQYKEKSARLKEVPLGRKSNHLFSDVNNLLFIVCKMYMRFALYIRAVHIPNTAGCGYPSL